jgi:ribosomal protein L11 methylase PrmA
MTVADLGSGSAVLSITLPSGASCVWAIEIDRCPGKRDGREANVLSRPCTSEAMLPYCPLVAPVDVVLANIIRR